MATFPGDEWLAAVHSRLNSDEQYARVAQNWEGDMRFKIEPSGSLIEPLEYYLDLWHGTCRQAYRLPGPAGTPPAAFTLSATYDNFSRILRGEIDPIQAMLTRKLKVEGNMAYILRNVPTVLNFVRCLRDVTGDFLA